MKTFEEVQDSPERDADKKKDPVGIEKEEQIIFQGIKNLENLDDFWISLNDQIQKRRDQDEDAEQHEVNKEENENKKEEVKEEVLD